MHRSVFPMTLVASGVLMVMGCSDPVPPEFAEGTYAALHRAEIENDCDKRVQCAARTNEYLRDDAFENCSSSQAMTLNAHPEVRLRFQLGIHRCTQPDVCQYVTCMDGEFVSFGETQLDEVNYVCTQKVQCLIDTSMLAGNAQSSFDDCVLQTVLGLDGALPEDQAAYQSSYPPCLPMTSCAFTACFPY